MKKAFGKVVLIALILSLVLISAFSVVSAATTLYVNPENSIVEPSQNFQVSIDINTDDGVYGTSFLVYFNPSVVQASDVIEGNFLNKDSNFTSLKMCKLGFPELCPKIDNVQGTVEFVNTRLGDVPNIFGSGSLAVINFTSSSSGISNLSLDNVIVLKRVSSDAVEIPSALRNGIIRINRIPSATNLLLSPSNPHTIDNLQASYTYSDSDGDAESGSEIRWYKNSVLQTVYNDKKTVPSSATTKGEKWYFTIRPKDGISFGNLVTSPNVTIQNSAPTINWFSPVELILKIREGSSLLFNHTSSDPDQDSLYYSWKLDSTEKATSKSWAFSSAVGNCGMHMIKLIVSDSQANIFKEWNITILLRGDVIINNKVDIFDLAKIGLCYSKDAAGTCEVADLTGDRKVDIFDLVTVGLNYGRGC